MSKHNNNPTPAFHSGTPISRRTIPSSEEGGLKITKEKELFKYLSGLISAQQPLIAVTDDLKSEVDHLLRDILAGSDMHLVHPEYVFFDIHWPTVDGVRSGGPTLSRDVIYFAAKLTYEYARQARAVSVIRACELLLELLDGENSGLLQYRKHDGKFWIKSTSKRRRVRGPKVRVKLPGPPPEEGFWSLVDTAGEMTHDYY